jgi:cyclophilin family peptidyl-prolyl cis-trans isomerase
VSCAPLIAATRDRAAHVVLAAVDALGAPCATQAPSVARLAELVAALSPGAAARRGTRGSWHAGAHAVVSLARVAPERARGVLPSLVRHPTWQVRMYAARAAGALGDTATLARLAADSSDNVRDAAVTSLSDLQRPAADGERPRLERLPRIDSIYMAQLRRSDYQLVLNAARALEGAPPSVPLARSLLAAFERLTAERSETSRDPRLELLARIQTLAGADETGRVTRYLSDFDPAVAERAADVLRAWGRAATASPQPLPRIAVSLAEVMRLRDARVRVTMAPRSGGGSFEVRLFADEAPATTSRFVTLARQGYYNGLTFHRIATNFVIQGGSPGANEYVGADRFMRDELGLRSHARGTLGISTRGRDTGDAQIFVNLIDNWRLDHDYTVFAEVVRGMDVVDAVLEGDVVARVEVVASQ